MDVNEIILYSLGYFINAKEQTISWYRDLIPGDYPYLQHVLMERTIAEQLRADLVNGDKLIDVYPAPKP